jgi:hypothetical protein
MAVRQIEKTDTLETGFRAKYNETIREIVVGADFPIPASGQAGLQQGDILRLNKSGGGFFNIKLSDYYVTNSKLAEIQGQNGYPYIGEWNEDNNPAGVVVDWEGALYLSNAITTSTDVPADVSFNNQNGEQQITVPDGYDFSNCKFFYGTSGNRFKEDSSRLEYDFVGLAVYATGFGDESAFIRFY